MESLGSDLLVYVDVDAPSMSATEVGAGDANGSMPALATLTARVEPSVKPAAGERIRLAVDPERLHFFDPPTGRALA